EDGLESQEKLVKAIKADLLGVAAKDLLEPGNACLKQAKKRKTASTLLLELANNSDAFVAPYKQGEQVDLSDYEDKLSPVNDKWRKLRTELEKQETEFARQRKELERQRRNMAQKQDA